MQSEKINSTSPPKSTSSPASLLPGQQLSGQTNQMDLFEVQQKLLTIPQFSEREQLIAQGMEFPPLKEQQEAAQKVETPIEQLVGQYKMSQTFNKINELQKYIKSSFLHCPLVTLVYSFETENLSLQEYLKEINTKSIEDYKRKFSRTIVGGYQKGFRIECDLEKRSTKLVLDYIHKFTTIDELMLQKYASQQAKYDNLDGIHLQRDFFEALYLIKQMSRFTNIDFEISPVFLPMQLSKVFSFWDSLNSFSVSCGKKSKLVVNTNQRRVQIRICFEERALCNSIADILGEDICSESTYDKIIFLDFPPNAKEMAGLNRMSRIVFFRVNLNVDNEIQEYNVTDLFTKLAINQPHIQMLYFRCMPYPPNEPLSDVSFTRVCRAVIKMKNLSNVYLDMNFSNAQILRINRIEQKIHQKQNVMQILKLWRDQYPQLHSVRWEIKFELFNMFLTEKMRDLKPILESTEATTKKNLIRKEYFGLI